MEDNLQKAFNDLKAQDGELGEQTVDQFISDSEGTLSFFDGLRWTAIKSHAHVDQMERALGAYLEKQLDHIEYTLALTMSKRRGELFEVYQQAVMGISDRIRTQTINYRDATTKKVLATLKAFLEEKNSFSESVSASNGLGEADKELLRSLNEEATGANVSAIFNEMKAELDHYHQMCERIYVGMADEIDKFAQMKDVSP